MSQCVHVWNRVPVLTWVVAANCPKPMAAECWQYKTDTFAKLLRRWPSAKKCSGRHGWDENCEKKNDPNLGLLDLCIRVGVCHVVCFFSRFKGSAKFFCSELPQVCPKLSKQTIFKCFTRRSMGEFQTATSSHRYWTNTSPCSVLASKSPATWSGVPCQQICRGEKTRSGEDHWFEELRDLRVSQWELKSNKSLCWNWIRMTPCCTMLLKGHVSSVDSTQALGGFSKRTYSGPLSAVESCESVERAWLLRMRWMYWIGSMVAAFVYTQALWHHLSAVWWFQFSLSSMSPKAQDVNSNSSPDPCLSCCQIIACWLSVSLTKKHIAQEIWIFQNYRATQSSMQVTLRFICHIFQAVNQQCHWQRMKSYWQNVLKWQVWPMMVLTYLAHVFKITTSIVCQHEKKQKQPHRKSALKRCLISSLVTNML